MVDDEGENRITLVPGANELLKADHEVLGRAVAGQFLLLQCEVPMSEVVLAAKIMRAKEAIVVLNPAPVCKLPDEIWSLVDIIVMNEIEATELAGLPVVDAASAAMAASSIRRRGPPTAIVTLGSQGVVVADDGGCRHFAALAVRTVDTTAAGDTFIGAMCAARAAGHSTDSAVMRGIQAATLCVTRAGAQASIPRLRRAGTRAASGSPFGSCMSIAIGAQSSDLQVRLLRRAGAMAAVPARRLAHRSSCRWSATLLGLLIGTLCAIGRGSRNPLDGAGLQRSMSRRSATRRCWCRSSSSTSGSPASG